MGERLKPLLTILKLHQIYYSGTYLPILPAVALLALGRVPEPAEFSQLLVLTLVALLLGAESNIVNNYYDYDIDRINKPESPPVKGEVQVGALGKAMTVEYVLNALALGVLWFVTRNLSIIIIASFAWVILHTYSAPPVRAKAFHYLTALTWYSVGIALLPLAGWLLFKPPSLAAAVYFLLLFGFNLMSWAAKEYKDIKGDRAHGIATISAKYGIRGVLTTVVGGLLVFVAVVLVAYLYGVFDVVLAVGMVIPLAFALRALHLLLLDADRHIYPAFVHTIVGSIALCWVLFALAIVMVIPGDL